MKKWLILALYVVLVVIGTQGGRYLPIPGLTPEELHVRRLDPQPAWYAAHGTCKGSTSCWEKLWDVEHYWVENR